MNWYLYVDAPIWAASSILMFKTIRLRRRRRREEAQLMAIQLLSNQLQPSVYWSSDLIASAPDGGSKVQFVLLSASAPSASSSTERTLRAEVTDLLVRARRPEVVEMCAGCKMNMLSDLIAHYNDIHCLPSGNRAETLWGQKAVDTAEEWWTRALELTL